MDWWPTADADPPTHTQLERKCPPWPLTPSVRFRSNLVTAVLGPVRESIACIHRGEDAVISNAHLTSPPSIPHHQVPRCVIKYFIGKKKSPSSREVGRTSSDIGTGHQLICRVFPEPILQDRTVEACTRRLGPQGAEAGVCLPVSGPEGRLEAGGKVWARSGA